MPAAPQGLQTRDPGLFRLHRVNGQVESINLSSRRYASGHPELGIADESDALKKNKYAQMRGDNNEIITTIRRS
jgi:hypothetical protein